MINAGVINAGRKQTIYVPLELRAEVSGPFNSPIFGDPRTDLSTPNSFGVITQASG